MSTSTITERIKLQFRSRRDMWISSAALAGDWDVADDRGAWLESVGPVRVNIACERRATPAEVAACISRVRRIRIGGDGRYPTVVVWLEPSDGASRLLSTVSQIDTSVPRIKVMLVAYVETPWTAALQTLWDAMKLRIDTRLLCVLYDTGTDGRCNSIALLEDANFAPSLNYEWFASSEGCNWRDCLALIKQLAQRGYGFNLHPLSLCGGIAHFVRANFLACFGGSFPPGQPDVHGHRLSPGSSYLQCAFDAADHVLGRRLSQLNLSCFCKTAAPTSDSFGPLSEYFTRNLTSQDDEILFEDWQYIYDGF